jgi:photosystem II stability/assembly factor-like uncharacterized protein
LALDSIAMFGDDGWAVTLDSAGPISNVLRTADGGSTWRKVTPLGAQDGFIFGFMPIDVRHAWLMSAGPSQGTGPVDLWSTNDGGQTWSKTTAPALVFRGALIMFSDGVHGWLATPGEPISQFQQQGIVIDRTTDGGKTWKLVSQTNFAPDRSTARAPSVNCGKGDLSFLNASTGWLTGGCTSGITFDMTSDGGVTWKAQELTPPRGGPFVKDCEGGPCALSAPRFVSAGYAYMVLHDTGLYPGRSWLYISRDGGRSWEAHALPGQETKVAMLTASIGFANVGAVVDSAGAVEAAAPWLYRTADGGTSWQPVPANVQLPYSSLRCVSASRCWALSQSLTSANSSALHETTDGGRTWSALTVRIL